MGLPQKSNDQKRSLRTDENKSPDEIDYEAVILQSIVRTINYCNNDCGAHVLRHRANEYKIYI